MFLRPINHSSGEVGPTLVVSLTSYGPRIRWVHLAIESMIASGASASDIYLWLANGSKITGQLDRLVRRGCVLGNTLRQILQLVLRG